MLEKINTPSDIKPLSAGDMRQLAGEIRELILKTVQSNGGHLASNLGAVELTLAIEYVFDLPQDKVIWDVGHQAYTHKILTGRREIFPGLRLTGGCRPFTSPAESPEFDVTVSGHAGVAVSGALGLAQAHFLSGKEGKVIAVLGDGVLNCGITLEGLNMVRSNGGRIIIILNDNKMSISENVGGFSSYLNRIIVNRRYGFLKAKLRRMLGHLPGSTKVLRLMSRLSNYTKNLLLPGGFFEELGIRYIGPINGHSLPELIKTLESIKDSDVPVLVHVVTEKGHGYLPAVEDPEKYHGVSPETFSVPVHGGDKTAQTPSFSAVFGLALRRLAETDEKVCAVVAAMTGGVGLHGFSARFPERFFDCGIAEEHCVVYSAGLAIGGKRVFTAIYDSFMQRALDNIYHDVCLADIPVIFGLDRSGMGEDGPTHHGIYSLGFLRAMPNLVIAAPSDGDMLNDMIFSAGTWNHPAVIRYPRGSSVRFDEKREPEMLPFGKSRTVADGSGAVLWAMGREVFTALEVREILSSEYGVSLRVVDPVFIKPLDEEALRRDAALPLFSLEDHCVTGGLGSAMSDAGAVLQKRFGWPVDREIPHGSPADVRKIFGLDAMSLAAEIAAQLGAERR